MSRYLFLSDLHIGIRDIERTKAFGRVLENISKNFEKLFILGDVVDFWAGANQKHIKSMTELLFYIKMTIKKGVSVSFIPGNRDFLLDLEIKKIGGKILDEGDSICISGKNILLCHGDSLCTRDVRYQNMKRVIRSTPVRIISRFFTPYFCLWIGDRMRRMSHVEVGSKSVKEMAPVMETIVDTFKTKGADIIICGHVHKKGEYSYNIEGQEKYLYTLPSWQNQIEGLIFYQGQFDWAIF